LELNCCEIEGNPLYQCTNGNSVDIACVENMCGSFGVDGTQQNCIDANCCKKDDNPVYTCTNGKPIDMACVEANCIGE